METLARGLSGEAPEKLTAGGTHRSERVMWSGGLEAWGDVKIGEIHRNGMISWRIVDSDR